MHTRFFGRTLKNLIPIPGKFRMKGWIYIIPITETEYHALRKVLSIENFMGMNCHYHKHYLVESQKCLNALEEYRKSIVVHSYFSDKKHK